MDETLKRWFERYSPDTKERWRDRLLLRNTGGAAYSLVTRPGGSPLFIPKAQAVEESCYCPLCNKPLKNTDPAQWFGDWFCGQCFEQMSGRPSR